MATSNQQANDTTNSLAGSNPAEAQTLPTHTQTPANEGDKAPAAGEISKNAAKKAAKKEKLASGKAEKANNQGGGKSEGSKKPANKVAPKPKKKIEGAALVGIDVAKEDDFSEWYDQVLTKGEMLEKYTVSGCYILKVILPLSHCT